MGLFDLPAQDKKVIFADFVIVELSTEVSPTPFQVRALPSFIGELETTEGIEIGADSFEISFDEDDETVQAAKLSEGDTVFYTRPKDSRQFKFEVHRIARDRFLGLKSCYLRLLVPEAEAGTLDRREDI